MQRLIEFIQQKQKPITLLVAIVLCLLPLWLTDYIPSTDLPSHVAISQVIYHFFSSAAPNSYYLPNWQPVPYYLIYFLLAPSVGLFGPLLGTKIILSLIAIAMTISLWLFLRAAHAPTWTIFGGIFAFYNASFFWGFVVTLVGLPAVVAGAWLLTRLSVTQQRRYLIGACLKGLIATFSHLFVAIAYIALIVAYVISQGRHRLASGALLLATTTLPLWPAIIASVPFVHRNHSVSDVVLKYGPPDAYWYRLKAQFGLFDHGLGRATNMLFFAMVICALVIAAIKWWRSNTRQVSKPGGNFLLCLSECWTGLFLLMPIEVTAGSISAYGINFRYMVLAEIAALALVPAIRSAWQRWLGILATVAACLHTIALIGFFQQYDAHAKRLESLWSSLPSGKTLRVVQKQRAYERAWAPADLHLHAYYVANGGGYDSALFAGAYIPIKPNEHVPVAEDLDHVAPFDYLLVRADEGQQIQTPVDGRAIVQAEDYTLFARTGVPQ